MRYVIALIAIIALSANLVSAGEKLPDTSDATSITASRSTLDGTFDENSPVYERCFGNGISYDCANPMTDSSTTDNFFAMFCFQATTTDFIEIMVDAATTELHDTTLTIYCDPFDFGNPLDNVVTYDDDGGDGLLSAFVLSDEISLTPGQNYFLVLSNFGSGDPDDMGAFSIMLGDNLIACGTVANDNMSWDSLKANFR